jgi:hypothetical protein
MAAIPVVVGLWMPGVRSQFVLGLLGLSLSLVYPAQATQRRSERKQVVKPQPQSAVPEPPPPSPATPTLAQMPATAPQVAYRDGALTIVAQNSTVGDILRAVQTQTGAAIEMPGNAPERVVGHFGPGPARDVLAELLNGSHFNYVMLGSAANPTVLERVILTSKSVSMASSDEPSLQSPNQPGQAGFPQPGARTPFSPPPTQEMANDDDDSDSGAPGDDQTAQPGNQSQQQPGNQPSPIKTPEQLLRELQRQQQQQQPGAPQGGPPAPAGRPQRD